MTTQYSLGRDGEPPLDVAIIGAGVAGVYTGWSLRTRASALAGNDGPPHVAIFEQGERVGGRLFTATPPHAPHLKCELGGMRYIDTQDLVVDLIAELGLASKPFMVGDEHNLNYLRGERFTLADLHAGSERIPYALAPDERGKAPPELLAKALEAFLADGAALTEAEKLQREREMTVDGQPVTKVPAIDVIRSALSAGGYDFLIEGMGYTCILDPAISAVNLIHTDLRGGTRRTLIDGMQALPLTLAQRFEGAGGQIALRHSLRTVEATGDAYRLHLDTPDGPIDVTARHVVLALPAQALRDLAPDSLPLTDAGFRRDLDSVVPVPAAKLYFGFESPWWEAAGLKDGRSDTDLPIRQCLYFGVESEQPDGDPTNTSALLVASYSDGDATGYWEQRVCVPPYYATPAGFPEGLAVSAAVVEDVRKQLEQVHGIPVPQPEWAAFQDWTPAPFGGGWHYWRVGHRSVDVVPRMRHPLPDERIYICGEAFSSHQAWILGALSSAEQMLQQQFGAPYPRWLRPDADLGA
ncbi:MAG: FAD-dependent oxidoreductase [Thiohalocapsa sp.]|uniref:flavin monoamine oxidase family protein n=1 Tax=Thiohalocapsa sp. TaxID=2497641 RepID=UPI0025F0FA65|nr:FAD-dependent oxidoreductase [Thiohalocapsa sp.]MCG6939747.1 FAD-dependent oxidoreductase [Thiohalocapsa sp.]